MRCCSGSGLFKTKRIQSGMEMDPVIKWIYRAYFNRHHWKTVGLPEEYSLLSALQNLANDRDFDHHSPTKEHIHKAYGLVRKYSTCK